MNLLWTFVHGYIIQITIFRCGRRAYRRSAVMYANALWAMTKCVIFCHSWLLLLLLFNNSLCTHQRYGSVRVFAPNSISFFQILFHIHLFSGMSACVGYLVAFKIQVVHGFNGSLVRLLYEYDRTLPSSSTTAQQSTQTVGRSTETMTIYLLASVDAIPSNEINYSNAFCATWKQSCMQCDKCIVCSTKINGFLS